MAAVVVVVVVVGGFEVIVVVVVTVVVLEEQPITSNEAVNARAIKSQASFLGNHFVRKLTLLSRSFPE